jgi:hypothetical protein
MIAVGPAHKISGVSNILHKINSDQHDCHVKKASAVSNTQVGGGEF